MSEEDRARWDARYGAGDWADLDEPARILRDAEAWLRPPGLVLDIACGAGRNALHLARRGFQVIGVDISWEGLRLLVERARAERLAVHAVHADLEELVVPDSKFDVIVNTRFLLRRLFPLYRSALRPDGLLIFETFNVEEIEVLGGDIRRAYALERGELLSAFGDFEILLYEEGVFEEEEGARGLARLVARRRAQ